MAATSEIEDLRRAYEGEPAYSEEFREVVTVREVHDPTASEAERCVVPIDVELPDGRVETTDLETVRGNVVAPASLSIEADAEHARELLDVITAGIEAVEEHSGESAAYARGVRRRLRCQHKRIDNSLTTRGR